MYTAIRRAFVLAAAVFSSSVFGDYVANRLDYVDPSNGAVATLTQLLTINNKGTAVGAASFDGSVTTFGFIYDPATGDYVRLPQPPGFDGITTFANPTGINDVGVITGSTFEPTGSRGFILKDGVFTFFRSRDGLRPTRERSVILRRRMSRAWWWDSSTTASSTQPRVRTDLSTTRIRQPSPRSIPPRSLRLHMVKMFSAKLSGTSSPTVPRSHLAAGASCLLRQPARIQCWAGQSATFALTTRGLGPAVSMTRV